MKEAGEDLNVNGKILCVYGLGEKILLQGLYHSSNSQVQYNLPNKIPIAFSTEIFINPKFHIEQQETLANKSSSEKNEKI